MILENQACTVEWIPTERIVVDDDEKRSYERVGFYLDLLQKDETGSAAPGLVVVWPHPDGCRYIAIDGRHRFLAHILDGRTRVRCLVTQTPAE